MLSDQCPSLCAVQDLIPLMASSVAALVDDTGDPSFKRMCLDVSHASPP